MKLPRLNTHNTADSITSFVLPVTQLLPILLSDTGGEHDCSVFPTMRFMKGTHSELTHGAIPAVPYSSRPARRSSLLAQQGAVAASLGPLAFQPHTLQPYPTPKDLKKPSHSLSVAAATCTALSSLLTLPLQPVGEGLGAAASCQRAHCLHQRPQTCLE